MNKLENIKTPQGTERSFGQLYISLDPDDLEKLLDEGEVNISNFNLRHAYNNYGLLLNAGDFFKARFKDRSEKIIRVISKEQVFDGDQEICGVYNVKLKIEEN